MPLASVLGPRTVPEQRTEDLLSRMSLEDKAGQLFHSQIGMGPGGTLADADPASGLPSSEDLVLGRHRCGLRTDVPQGRLPFDLPSSAPAVEDSRSDIPFDTADPLFRFGDGIGFRR